LLSDKQLNTDGIVLVDDATAVEVLIGQGKGLLEVITATDLEEAVNSIKVDYFAYLTEVVATGVGIKTALEGSAGKLNSIITRFNSATGVNALVIYDDTLNLLEQ
jgi:hypothetical protein